MKPEFSAFIAFPAQSCTLVSHHRPHRQIRRFGDIEDGVNAPTAEVYDKLIKELKPDLQARQRMDRLYMAIRKVPPPDICRTITQNKDLVDAMRKLEGCNLTPDQIESVATLFASFQENREGEPITYLHKIYEDILFNYSIKVFSFKKRAKRHIPKIDALTFAFFT